MRERPLRAPSFVALVAAVLAVGCESGTAPLPNGSEVDLATLFRPATAQETASVEADWAGRDPAVEGVREELSFAVPLGGRPATAHVLSHVVDGARHYGAVALPDDAEGRLPVLVYAHGGDQGVSIGELTAIASFLGPAAADFAWVVPSFRSEPLAAGGSVFLSEGAASPWDRDVDDALALLAAVLETFQAADPERVAVLGVSRGGGVALLMGIREPRIDRVVELSGPTDFLGEYARQVVEEALDGRLRPLPGLTTLDQRFIQPLKAGDVGLEEVRVELLRRSPALFARRLPPVQLHHGTSDEVVDVSQAESLIAALEALERGDHVDEPYLYPGGTHNPITLVGAIGRAVAFLSPLLGAPTVGVSGSGNPARR